MVRRAPSYAATPSRCRSRSGDEPATGTWPAEHRATYVDRGGDFDASPPRETCASNDSCTGGATTVVDPPDRYGPYAACEAVVQEPAPSLRRQAIARRSPRASWASGRRSCAYDAYDGGTRQAALPARLTPA
ncbi:hypothetical protein GCM10022227_54380 [Streptomyces sedi]